MIKISLLDKKGSIRDFTMIDDCDKHLCYDGWYLNGRGYVEKSGSVLMHHVILGFPKKGYEVDHINRDRIDNRRSNLRFLTVKENRENNSGQVDASSEYRGVSWDKRSRKWHAYGHISRKKIGLGYFIDEEKAADIAKEFRLQNMDNSGD